MLDALVVAPHPDDAELGVGGTIVRLIEPGVEGRHPRPDQRRADAAGDASSAGRRRRPRRTRRWATPGGRTSACRTGAWSRPWPTAAPWPPSSGRSGPGCSSPPTGRTPTPTTPPRPSSSRTPGSGASSRSPTSPATPFHPARILYYFSVHLRIVERPSFLLDISDQLDAKVAALRCYRSQLVDNQPAGRPGVIDSVCDRTRFWGHTRRRPPRRAVRQPRAGRAVEPGATSAVAGNPTCIKAMPRCQAELRHAARGAFDAEPAGGVEAIASGKRLALGLEDAGGQVRRVVVERRARSSGG